MLLSTAGAGLAVSGLSGQNNASIAVYGGNATPTGGGNVLGDQDSGTNVLPEAQTGGGTSPSGTKGKGKGTATQPARQVEAGANTGSLPFTGFAAIPVLLGGIVLLSAGLVLRRRTGERALTARDDAFVREAGSGPPLVVNRSLERDGRLLGESARRRFGPAERSARARRRVSGSSGLRRTASCAAGRPSLPASAWTTASP